MPMNSPQGGRNWNFVQRYYCSSSSFSRISYPAPKVELPKGGKKEAEKKMPQEGEE